MKILIVEDTVMIRDMEKRAILREAPDAEIIEAASLSRAGTVLDSGEVIDFAILDQHILDGNANEIALRLNAIGVPYVRFVGEPDTLPPEVQGRAVIGKTSSQSWRQLRDEIRRALVPSNPEARAQ